MIINGKNTAVFSAVAAPTPASQSHFGAVLQGRTTKAPDAAAQLDDYMKMTPAQRIRDDLLKKLGLTEEELAAKSPEERQSLESKLRDLVKQQMDQANQGQHATRPQVGQWIDTAA